MKQGRGPGSKKDEKDVPKPEEPAPGKKPLVQQPTTTAAPKPAESVTAVPTTAHATKKRETEDDLQPRWRQLRTFSKRRRSDDKDDDKENDETKDEAANETKDAEETTEATTATRETTTEPTQAPATDQDPVTETPD